MTLLRRALFLSSLMAGGCSSIPLANGSLCRSAEFHEAFLEGRDTGDYPSPSPRITQYGDMALPCLRSIAEGRPEEISLHQCRTDSQGCAVWALGAIGRIGTPEARRYLTEYLGRGSSARTIMVAAGMLGNLKATEARPALLGLLSHPDDEVRARTILALGVIGNAEDFDLLLEKTLTLPDAIIYVGAQGLLKLGDVRAADPLEKRAERVDDPHARQAIMSVVAKLRSK